MQILRSILYTVFLFLFLETIALSSVSWSFYESVRNSLRQEAILSDHRARDLVLALAKASELRLTQNGIHELNKTFLRYKEQSSQDPERFLIEKIVLVNPKGIILAHSNPEEVADKIENRKPSPEFENQQFFRIALRMRKWEWSLPIVTPGLNPPLDPVIPKWANKILHYIPEAKANQAVMASPVYHESKLDVMGLVFVTYTRGNLALLLENQWKLCQWMVLNYSVIAFGSTLFLSALYLLFQVLGSSKRDASEVEEQPNFFEKKVFSSLPNSTLEDASENKKEPVTSQEGGTILAPVVENETTLPLQMTPEPPKGRVMDAIYLG